MELPENFYKLVEQTGYLKNILYGDSVSKDSLVVVMFKNRDVYETFTFDKLWDKLVNEFKCEVINNINQPIKNLVINDKFKSLSYDEKCEVINNINQYIFINDEFKSLSYDEKLDSIILQSPQYIMRHKYKGKLIRLNFTGHKYLDVTQSHSMLDYDPDSRSFKKKKPKQLVYAPVMRNQYLKNCEPLELRSTFYGKGRTKQNSQITKKENLAHLKNIKPVRILSKEEINYFDNVYDLSFHSYQNFFASGVLVHNTDSIFLTIPMKNASDASTEDRWKLAQKSAEEINKLILDYVTQSLLPRCNINSQHNNTYFKTEMLLDSAMFLDVKKNYAYTLACKEGVVISPPKAKYTGIQVVKSDAAKLTQEMLKVMIEKVMLNTKIKRVDRIKELGQIINQFYNQFIENVKNYMFHDIGFPGKWSKKELFINGMKIYNVLMEEEIFNLGSSGKFLYCNFSDHSIIKKLATDIKTPGICIPYEYNVPIIKKKMEDAQIFVDQKLHWEKLFTTTCHRVIDLAKSEGKSLNSLI